MNLREYFRSRNIKSFAEEHGLSYPYLRQLISGFRKPSPDLAARISAATNGEVSIMELLFPNGIPGGESRSPDSVVEEREGDTGHI